MNMLHKLCLFEDAQSLTSSTLLSKRPTKNSRPELATICSLHPFVSNDSVIQTHVRER